MQRKSVAEVSPALDLLMSLAEGCAKAATLTPTFSSLLLAQAMSGIETPPEKLQERRFSRVSANWTVSGCEAVFEDAENGQKYHVEINPI
jgi:hypothetical protein